MKTRSGRLISIVVTIAVCCGLIATIVLGRWRPFVAAAAPASAAAQIAHVGAGESGSCRLDTDGTIACWGGFWPDDPMDIPPSGSFSQISLGGKNNCALRADGTAACWGTDYYNLSTPPAGTY